MINLSYAALGASLAVLAITAATAAATADTGATDRHQRPVAVQYVTANVAFGAAQPDCFDYTGDDWGRDCVVPGPPIGVRLGANGCEYLDDPDAMDYLSGRACPPEGFPYFPIIDDTKAGKRALDPYGDGCSGKDIPFGSDTTPETTATFNRFDACATHDYGWDLIRYGAPGITRQGVDGNFLNDMLADCEGRGFVRERLCKKPLTST